MAASMKTAGLEVVGFDIEPHKARAFTRPGEAPAGTPCEAARGMPIVVIVVHDEAQVEDVLWGPGGAASGMSPGTVVWLASTVSPSYARELGERLEARGQTLLDGPVSGGTTGAIAGGLTAIVGGTSQGMSIAEPALAACTSRVFHVGPAGAGSAVKMINQVMVAVHSLLTGEAMALATGIGLEQAKAIEVINHSAGSSVIFGKRAPRIAAGQHQVEVSIATLHKDLAIAIAAARGVGLRLPLAEKALEILQDAVDLGRGGLSDTCLFGAPVGGDSSAA